MTEVKTERPDFVEDEHLTFLDWLREDGRTNMFGARPYLLQAYPDLSCKQASEVLAYWMKTFGDRHPKEATCLND